VYVGDIDPSLIKMLPDGKEQFHVNLDVESTVPLRALSEQMRGYYSSISFLDHQVGRVLNALEEVRTAGSRGSVLPRWRPPAARSAGCLDHCLW
jgi:hypothetical protein